MSIHILADRDCGNVMTEAAPGLSAHCCCVLLAASIHGQGAAMHQCAQMRNRQRCTEGRQCTRSDTAPGLDTVFMY